MAEKKLHSLPPSYANLGFDGEESPGPSAPTHHGERKPGQDFSEPLALPTAPRPEPQEDLGPPPMLYDPPSLVFEDIYEAVAKYAKDNCCYGTKFVNQMKLTDISNKGVFYYTLESFGEKRETGFSDCPYRGGSVDGPENGPPPKPWDMTVIPSEYFRDDSTRKRIPHTEKVETCRNCRGRGEDTCSSCYGKGYDSCSRCNGTGSERTESSAYSSCSSCYGSGRHGCSRCSETGKVTCSNCSGYGKITEYKTLIVTWKNHVSEYISDAGNIPNELIRESKKVELFNQKDRELKPLTNAPDPSVNAASLVLLGKHSTGFPNERILRQRHILRAVPYTRATYKWKEREGEFYIYGTDRKVYFEDYPQPCCCCTCC